MAIINGFDIMYLDSNNRNLEADNNPGAQRIIRNIERISERYKEYIKTEIKEESAKNTQQAEQIDKLRRLPKSQTPSK